MVDPAVGLMLLKKPGDAVAVGEPLVEIQARDTTEIARCRELLHEAIAVSPQRLASIPLILGSIG